MIRVLIIDDHALMRSGVVRLLREASDIEVVGEAGSAEEGLSLAKRLAPDVILMDLHLPGMSGLEATERLLRGNAKARVVMLTMQVEDPFPRRLLEIGASGYLTKACPHDELIAAVRKVAMGGRYLSPGIAERLALSTLPGANAHSPFDLLTPRELDVALGLARGDDMQTIGRRLAISAKTVATHKYRVYEKLGVTGEVAIALMALQFGLIVPGNLRVRSV